MKNEASYFTSSWFAYIAFLSLGFIFCFILIRGAWNTSIEENKNGFYLDSLLINKDISKKVLTADHIINNIASFVLANEKISGIEFETFAKDILNQHEYIEAISYYPSNNKLNNKYIVRHNSHGVNYKEALYIKDIYSNVSYKAAINSSLKNGVVIPVLPIIKNSPDKKYILLKTISVDPLSPRKPTTPYLNNKGVVSVLISATKIFGKQTGYNNLDIFIHAETINLYGRELLYTDKVYEKKVAYLDRLTEKSTIQFPSYFLSIIIDKNVYISDLKYHLILISFLIGIGVLILIYSLIMTKNRQEKELRSRNKIIEKKVKEQTQELAIARDEALQVAEIKTEFLVSMSHEIRTPLNAVIGVSDLMQDTKLNKEQSLYMGIFKKAVDSLLNLVNDILDLSKIDAKKIILEEIPFNIRDILEESADIYAIKAAEKNIEITLYIDSTVNLQRKGDPSRLKQIILNLVGNALKFTDDGEINIALTRGSNSKGNTNNFIICIKDTGIGIPEDKINNIFTNFYQVDVSTTRKYGGTGLGLAIVNHLTQLMGGNVWAKSKWQQGSSFFVEINLPTIGCLPVGEKFLSKKNVLILDKKDSNCLAIKEYLISTAATIIKFNNQNDAIKKIKGSTSIDLLLIDSQFIFTRKNILAPLLQELSLVDKVILLINPIDVSKHAKKTLTNKFKNILYKPVKQLDLIGIIKLILKKDKSHTNAPAIKQKNNEFAFEADDIKHILLVEDNLDNRLLIRAYLKGTPHKLDEAENGEIALEKFKNTSYDLILMDMQMPVMDGYEATKRIRFLEKEQNRKKIKIISLTAHAIEEEIDKCIKAGCDFHLAKPIRKATFLQVISEKL